MRDARGQMTTGGSSPGATPAPAGCSPAPGCGPTRPGRSHDAGWGDQVRRFPGSRWGDGAPLGRVRPARRARAVPARGEPTGWNALFSRLILTGPRLTRLGTCYASVNCRVPGEGG